MEELPLENEPLKAPCFWELVAKRKANDPKWEWFKSEVVGEHDFLFEGGEPRIVTRGPRKGRRTWKHLRPEQIKKVVVTQEEIRQAQTDYERETGKCHECGGTGQEFWGWNHETGSKYRPCRRCDATGDAPMNAQSSTERGEANQEPTHEDQEGKEAVVEGGRAVEL